MKKIFLAFAISMLVQIGAFAAIKVSPMVIELDANSAKGNYLTTSVDVQGGSDQAIRFKVYPEFFEITDDGKMNPIAKSDSLNSLIPHARIVPNEFTIQKGQTQKVRLTFTDLKALPDGESRMVMFLEDVNAKELNIPSAKKNISTRLIVKTRVGVPIYVDKGNVIKVGNFEDLQVEKIDNDLVYKMKLSTGGNSKVRYGGTVQVAKGKALIDELKLNSSVIKSQGVTFAQGKVPIEKINENGDYTLRIMLNYKDSTGKTKKLLKEANFNVENIKSIQI